LKPCDREGHDQYHSDGLAGTRRYMAPEVAEVSPYGFSADVYSFAIVLWEMLTFKAAFEKYSRERHYKEIIVEGKRPNLSRSWPFVVKNLLQRCWAAKPSDRPTFQSVCEKIKFGLPDQTHRSDRSTDSLMKRSIKSISYHPAADLSGLEYYRQADSLSTSIRAQRDILSDSLSTSIRIKSPFLQNSNTYGHSQEHAMSVSDVLAAGK
jgi:serine/threonine protein kinase